MDVDATQAQWTNKKGPQKDKREVTCFNCGKKGHYKRDCRSTKKDWKPVPGKEVANIDKHGARVIEIAAASYTQDDLEDAADRQLLAEEAEAEPAREEREECRQAAAHPDTIERILAQQGPESEESDSGTEEEGSTGSYDADDDGDIAPPIWQIHSARQWGLTLTQNEEGVWSTTNPGDTPGPNLRYLKKRILELRDLVVHKASQTEDIHCELQEAQRKNLEYASRLERIEEGRDNFRRELARIKELADSIAENTAAANTSVERTREELRRLRTETHDILDSDARGSLPWDGPTEEMVDNYTNTNIVNPEWEYNYHCDAQTREQQEVPTWEDYWKSRDHTTSGRETGDLEWIGYGARFQYLEGDDARLHPRRQDHVQVPWFQCVAHECRYHFKDKLDNDFWPLRPWDDEGEEMAVTWTYDHGQGAEQNLWYIERSDTKLRCWPKRAWPKECRVSSLDWCKTKDCLWHASARIRAHWAQQRMSNVLRMTPRHRQERQQERNLARARQTIVDRAMNQWLEEHQTLDAASQGADRDALKHQEDLGNDSGPSQGPDDL
jgi:hypothetical protein